MVVTGQHPICGEIAEALGIKNCTKIDLHMQIDKIVTVEVEFHVEKSQLEDIAKVLKKYKLVLEE